MTEFERPHNPASAPTGDPASAPAAKPGAPGDEPPAEPEPSEPAAGPAPAPAAGDRSGPAPDDADDWGNPDGVIPRELIDPDAVKILRRLRRHGFTAYLVGGGVRDLLLGRTPKDFDIATSALPDEIKRLFRNCRIIGRRFRLAHVFFREKIVEVSTFRATVDPLANGSGAPGSGDVAEQVDLLIRNDNVFGTAEEDAVRRDFTVNGLFYDVERGEVIDYVGGREDLERRIIRTIGDPDIRFREDPIRMLRAIKFAARLGFTLDPATEAAIRRHRHDIRRSAPPRIFEEVLRLLRGGAALQSFRLMAETGVLEVLVPELQNLYRLVGEGNPIARYLWGSLEAHLQGLDAAGPARAGASNAVLLGAVVLPLLLDRPDGLPAWAPPGLPPAGEEGPGAGRGRRRRSPAGRAARTGVVGEVDGIVAALALRLMVPRRDVETLRGALLLLWRMLHRPRDRRAAALARRPAFREALNLLRVRDAACRHELSGEVAAWEGILAGSAAAAETGDETGRSGRRRRRTRALGPAEAPRAGPGLQGGRPRGRPGDPLRAGRRSPAAEAVPTLLVGGPAAARAAADAGRFGAGFPPRGPGAAGGEAGYGGAGRRRRRRRRGRRKPDGDDASS